MSNNRTIRLATLDDLPRIMELIDCGRKKMRAVGNVDQWTDGNPRREILQRDIEDGNSYLIEDEGISIATFAFMEGPEPTYANIYEGQWLDEQGGDSLRSIRSYGYWVIHRIASAPGTHGILKTIFHYCLSRTLNIRIDTHRQNVVMRAVLPKYGFRYCGIIYLANGAERLAYQHLPY